MIYIFVPTLYDWFFAPFSLAGSLFFVFRLNAVNKMYYRYFTTVSTPTINIAC